MNKGNSRVHILVRNEATIQLWTKGPIVAKLSDSSRRAINPDFSKNIPIFEVVATNLNPLRQPLYTVRLGMFAIIPRVLLYYFKEICAVNSECIVATLRAYEESEGKEDDKRVVERWGGSSRAHRC